ncbi:MAG: hypothetical protein ACK5L0_03605 [Candidatus Fimivivens sp.]
MKKSARLGAKIKKLYKERETQLSPLLAGLLAECDRIQEIQDRLWDIASTEPLITEYTNKAGASNLTASAALKELRSWELVFQGACRSIFKILKDDFPDIDDDDDELAEYI